MSTSPLPEKARCRDCGQEHRLDATVPGLAHLPMLVCLKKVTSAEQATASVQCQICCRNGGMPDKGLLATLTRLQAPSPASGTVTTTTTSRTTLQQMLSTVSLGSAGPSRPSPPQQSWGGAQRYGRGGRQASDEPELTRAQVRQALREQPIAKPSTLGAIAGDTLKEAFAVSERAAQQARERLVLERAAKRRVRSALFASLIRSLVSQLGTLRRLAPKQSLVAELERFHATVSRAVDADVKQRGRKILLEELKVTAGELHDFQYAPELFVTFAPSGGGGGDDGPARTGKVEQRLRDPRAKVCVHRLGSPILQIDPLRGREGAQCWSAQGVTRAVYIELVSVLGHSGVPEPNPPREGYQGPTLVYNDDQSMVWIRFSDDRFVLTFNVQSKGEVQLCGKGMYARMICENHQWVYYPCLPGKDLDKHPQHLTWLDTVALVPVGQTLVRKQTVLQELERQDFMAQLERDLHWSYDVLQDVLPKRIRYLDPMAQQLLGTQTPDDDELALSVDEGAQAEA